MARVVLTFRGDPMLMNELVGLAKAAKAGRSNAIGYVVTDEITKWRDVGRKLAETALEEGTAQPLVPPVRVTCTHLRKNEQPIDTMAVALACKSLVDGAVAGGLIPDDRDTLVTETRFPAHRTVGYEGIELVIETVPADTAGRLL
jgi:hypothetical protein